MNFKIERLFLILFFLIISKLSGQSVSIWIDPKPGMTSCVYTSKSQKVWILSGDTVPERITEISFGQSITTKYLAGRVFVYKDGLSLGSWPEIILWAVDSIGRFSLTPEGAKKTTEYYDHLKVQAHKNQLRMINIVWMENYICGVVAAEGGLYKTPEFLKVQAICSRTYAMRNMGKFVREGFDLTDKVDCQVYHGIPKNLPGVEDAVLATAGLIAVDEFGEPIDAVFSANCGGQSANSEDVWKATSSYLKSTESYDQYREFKNSSWTYTLSRLDFLNLLSKYYKTPILDWEVVPDASGRVKQIRLNQDPGLVLSGIEMRSLLKLKSTKFRLFEYQQQVFFSGQGFGHGVGMCQDGAYKLSSIGWSHESILRHFYQGIELLSIQEWLMRLASGKSTLIVEEISYTEP